MKKFFLTTIILITSLITPINVIATSTTNAIEKIDITKNSNLTLNYAYDNHTFNNISVKLYHIATATPDFQYQLISNFSNYPLQINGLTTETEWNHLEQTLEAYIIADDIKETYSQTIEKNTITFSNLTPGLYLIKTPQITTSTYTLQFDTFLISIPNLKENGTWNYDVTVNPKAEEYLPQYKKITYTAVKEWLTRSTPRPQSIDIEIYKDAILIEKQILTSSNNWTYSWQTDDDGSTWTVVERNIPNNYTVSILKEKNTFIILNTDTTYQENSPQTLDNINFYFYLFLGSFIGLILLTISLILLKKTTK